MAGPIRAPRARRGGEDERSEPAAGRAVRLAGLPVAAAFAGTPYTPPSLEDRWRLVRRHCSEEVTARGDERIGMQGMRSRLMAYTRGMHDARPLRAVLSKVVSLPELDDIIAGHLDGALPEGA